MTEIIEEAENTKLERIVTVKTRRGEEYLFNLDRTICALAELFSDESHEISLGWTLNAGWYESALSKVKAEAQSNA